MKDYRDVWIVLRIDGPAQGYTDYVSVKGVYNSQEEAQAAADRAAEVNPPFDTQYHILKKKQAISAHEHDADLGAADRIQGLSRSMLEAVRFPTAYQKWHSLLRELAQSVPSETRSRAFAPLAAYFAEQIVAQALHGRVNADPKSSVDVILDDGRTIDVKSVLLAHGAKRAPFITLQRSKAAFVALVVFTPELDLAAGFLLPMSAMEKYSRETVNRDDKIGVRVTPDLLASPGVRPLQLPITDLTPPIG
jgi:hypothetical protein